MVKWRPRRSVPLWDAGMLITGLAILWVQLGLWAILGRAPDTGLLAVGFGLMSPAARKHVSTVLGSGGATSSSESSPPPPSPSPPSSGPPEGGAGEQHE